MAKENKFYVKKIKEQNIIVEEEKKHHSPFILFLIKNGKLIFTITLSLSLIIFIVALYFSIININDSSIVKYESNGVLVNFNSSDKSIINGTPITEEYANKVFNNNIKSSSNEGVVIKLKEEICKFGKIVFYSDKTVLIKYNDGTYMRVYAVNNNYGIDKDGILNARAKTEKLTGEIKRNSLGMDILYLSDNSVEVTYKGNTIFVRNNDITDIENMFYTNLSIISLKLKEENGKIYYSNNTIKENNMLVVDGKYYKITEEKNIHDNIKIIYYENGYAEVINDKNSILVEKSEHIKYDNYIFEIVYQTEKINVKDVMDIKEITLDNTNIKPVSYLVVLEETNNYQKHNISRILNNEFINFKVYVDGKIYNSNVLNNNLKDNKSYNFNANTYLLSEGQIKELTKTNISIGLWINYEKITNEYMNSAFIGTVKVYIEELN